MAAAMNPIFNYTFNPLGWETGTGNQ